MSEVHILAIDLAKRSFQVCATALGGAVLFIWPSSDLLSPKGRPISKWSRA